MIQVATRLIPILILASRLHSSGTATKIPPPPPPQPMMMMRRNLNPPMMILMRLLRLLRLTETAAAQTCHSPKDTVPAPMINNKVDDVDDNEDAGKDTAYYYNISDVDEAEEEEKKGNVMMMMNGAKRWDGRARG